MKESRIHINWIVILLMALAFSCHKEEQYDTLYPLEYFPAYPGSYWVYTNGITRTTAAYYQLHTLNGEEMYVPVYEGEIVNGYKLGNKELINFGGSSWPVNEFDGSPVYRQIVNADTMLEINQFPYFHESRCDTLIVDVTAVPVDTLINLLEVSSCNGYENCDTILLNCNDPHACDTFYYALIEEIIWIDTSFVDTLYVGCDSTTYYDSVIVVKEFVQDLDEINCWFYKDYYAKNVGLVKREVASCSDSTSYITEFELVKYFINK